MAYSEKVMDHFQHPRNVGKMDDADGVGEVGNAKCGDIMKIYIKVKDDIITDIKFNTFGCGSAKILLQASLHRIYDFLTLDHIISITT